MRDAADLVLASRHRLVGAYDAWLARRGRAERQGDWTPERHSDRRFVEELRRLIALGREEIPPKLGVPTTRSGWSNWRKGRSAANVKLRLDVCRAVHVLTGIDVTANQFLSEAPVNATDLVSIGTVTGQESAVGSVTVTVSFVDFRTSDAQPVFLADVRHSREARSEPNLLGSVRFGLKQASLFASNTGDLEPLLTHLSDGSSSQHGTANGAEVSLDDEAPLRWRVQPPFPKEALQARFTEVQLCQGKPTLDSDGIVAVSVQSADVTPSIDFDKRAKISDREYRETKKRLVERLIKDKFLDNGPRTRHVLSQSRIKWQ
ncbi:hypothetical protein [Tateyamaria sp. syn59]|uniref:hypothetical protein n=1 Tax=Tateyamaria sp. syn59 TaxID=2576942 RepID=UPI0011BE49F4|nr:hypothetical protein [Tateyamaria sp. syn59]